MFAIQQELVLEKVYGIVQINGWILSFLEAIGLKLDVNASLPLQKDAHKIENFSFFEEILGDFTRF